MCYEPGQAVVQTYTRRRYKISTVTVVAAVVEVDVRVYVCVFKPLSFCSRYCSMTLTSCATEIIRAPKAKDPV